MVMVNLNGVIMTNIKDNGHKIWEMDKENSNLIKEILMMDSGKTTKGMV